MTLAEIKRFAESIEHMPPNVENSAVGEAAKDQFLIHGKALCREIARRLGWPRGSFRVYANPSGWSVWDDAYLESDRLIVTVSDSRHGLLYRLAGGRDEAGRPLHHPNHWVAWPAVGRDIDGVVRMIDYTLRHHPDALAGRAQMDNRTVANATEG